jgi:hypothetical protein
MKWVLVLVVIANGEAHSSYINEYDSMIDCFSAREYLAAEAGGEPGYFLKGMQGICIHTEQGELM